MDGKHIPTRHYVSPRWIWSVDFLRHDFPIGIFAPSENLEAFLKFFRLLKTINYPLRVVIADDISFTNSLETLLSQGQSTIVPDSICGEYSAITAYPTEDRYRVFFHHLITTVFPIDASQSARGSLFQLYNGLGIIQSSSGC